jgi:hypothetical protein
MVNRTVVSLALLKAQWEVNKHDYLDTFVPLVVEHCCPKRDRLVVSVVERAGFGIGESGF